MIRTAFLTLDFWMDLGMLLVAQLSFGRFHPIRLLSAACLLCICTLAVLRINPPAAWMFFIHILVFPLGAWLATGERRTGRILEAAACMFCFSAAAAGFVSLNRGHALPIAAAGGALLLCLLRRRRHESFRWNIEVYVEKDGLCASFPALIDTGNRLREQHGGLPVLIVEASALSTMAEHIATLPEEQVQVLPYGVLGSSGEIRCFRPDRVDILLPLKGACPAPPCWIAVYPGRIPGSTRALAPPAFTTALETKRTHFKRQFEIE